MALSTTEQVYRTLRDLNSFGQAPSARALTDRLEREDFHTARFSDKQVRSALVRLEKKGKVERITAEREPIRWKVVGDNGEG
jgi:DNA-binding PadR family transcriptional regulator